MSCYYLQSSPNMVPEEEIRAQLRTKNIIISFAFHNLRHREETNITRDRVLHEY